MFLKARRGFAGFTLIELLVVIAIIGVLASIVMVSLGGSRSSARDAKRVSDIRQIKYALEVYSIAHGYYPTCIYTSGCTGTTHLEGDKAMPAPPKDPLGQVYTYAAKGSVSNCTSYHLGTVLENKGSLPLKTDADATRVTTGLCTGSTDFSGLDTATAGTGGAKCSTAVGTNGGTETCYDLIP